MGICDLPADTTPRAKRSAVRIRELCGQSLGLLEHNLLQIANELRGQRAAAAAELGAADAAALVNVYEKLRQAVEAGRGIQVEPLPAS